MSSSSPRFPSHRLTADVRQFGGLILALGICAMFGALAGVVSGAGRDGTTPNENGIPLWSFVGACGQAFFGAVGIVVGYLSLVGDTGHHLLTFMLCVFIQLAWIPYITGMAGIGKQAANPETQLLVPFELEPTTTDVQFVGAMGIVTVLAHGFSFIGSLSFMSFALLAYQREQYQDRAAGYYHGRLLTYSVPVVLAGICQISIGSYAIAKYGSGPYPSPINVAVLTIFFPGMSVFTGIVQLLTGLVGVTRFFFFQKAAAEKERCCNCYKWSFQYLCGFNWLCMMVLQLCVQIGYAPGDRFAAAAPTRACLFFGFSLMPAYLDYKWRTTPETLGADYYYYNDSANLLKSDDTLEENDDHVVKPQDVTMEVEEGGNDVPDTF